MPMRVLGHRGASADFPENTIQAFVEAMRQGAAGVELDVMRCASGELVVCHDERLDRLAGLPWVVARTPWAKLKQADVGSTLGFSPARIPLFDEVFDALPTEAVVNIELKCDDFDDRGLARAVAERVEARALQARIFVSSFNPTCLLRFAEAAPSVRRGFLIDPDRAWWPQAMLLAPLTSRTSVHPHFSACTEQRVAAWHRRGWEVATWTVDDVAQATQLQGWGVDWLITNHPARLLDGLRR